MVENVLINAYTHTYIYKKTNRYAWPGKMPDRNPHTKSGLLFVSVGWHLVLASEELEARARSESYLPRAAKRPQRHDLTSPHLLPFASLSSPPSSPPLSWLPALPASVKIMYGTRTQSLSEIAREKILLLFLRAALPHRCWSMARCPLRSSD